MWSSLLSSKGPVLFDAFYKRGAAVKSLCETFTTGAPVRAVAPIHAVLLTGPAGVGKRTLAALCLRSLHCKGAIKPCNVCPACKRVLAGSHPDVHHIQESKRVGVDEIRALLSTLYTTPYEGGFQTVQIDCAGAMTPQAQNSLLKTLEEPPPQTVFVLTVKTITEVLPTIVSRCRVVALPPMTEEGLVEALQTRGILPIRARQLARMANGSVGEALIMDEDATYWALHDTLGKAMASIHSAADMWSVIATLKDEKENAARICSMIEHELREAFYHKVHYQDAIHQGMIYQDAPVQNHWYIALKDAPPRSLLWLLEKLQLVRRMLSSNVSWQAAIERFVLDYSEEMNTWQLS